MLGICLLAAALDGPFPILMTPYTDSGEVDYETLSRETRFIADTGVNGIIWPAALDAINHLDAEEERRGLEVIARALVGRNVCFTPCCPGTNTADAVRRVRQAEEIAARHSALSLAMLVRMADGSKNDADHERHYEAVARVAKHPVIIQTFNAPSPAPSAKLLIDLARRYPDVYGWYKVEGSSKDIADLAAELVAAKPVVKTVLNGWGGRDMLYHYRRVGTRGVITQRPSYADLLVKIWNALEVGSPAADELFMRMLLLRNLDDVLPEKEMRGWHLYALMRRGVFKNTVSRTVRKNGVWQLETTALTTRQIEEIESRMKLCGIELGPR